MGNLIAAQLANPTLLPCNVLLLVGEAPRHGYELVEALAQFGLPMRRTDVYRTLRKLEEDGLLRSQWEFPSRGSPARRVYCLTPAGEFALESCASKAAELGANLRRYRKRYDRLRRVTNLPRPITP